jgi:peroxiredoxin (alkyl hydroperoxide reductase subunit C)
VTIAKVGRPAPDFKLPSTKNMETLAENISLADYKGKWLILLSIRLISLRLPTEMTAFSDRLEEINGIGAEVLGCSTDRFIRTALDQNAARSKRRRGLHIRCISDVGGKLAAKYNILVEEEESLCAAFIHQSEGVLQYAVVHDLNIGRSVDETLRVLQGFRPAGCARPTGLRAGNLKV